MGENQNRDARILVLGPVAVVGADGAPVDVTGHAGRLLVELVSRGPFLSRSRLLHAVWPDERPKSADAALRVHLSRLRRLLEGSGARLERRADGHELVGGRTDFAAFDDLLSRARARRVDATGPDDLDAAAALVDEALTLWRGEPLTPFGDEPELDDVVRAMTGRRLDAEDLTADLVLDRGRHAEALGQFEQAVADRPFEERGWARLMLARYRSGRQRDALAAFEHARRILIDELGVEPGPELRRLQNDILIQHPDLDWEPLCPATGEPVAAAAFETGADLHGRDKDIARVIAALEEGALVTVTGSPGIGKSRVIEAVRARLQDRMPTVAIDAESVATAELLPFALADVLDLEPDPGSDIELLDLLAAKLAVTPTLLVVDGGEHLDPGVRSFVAALFDRAADLRMLVGHRAALELDGEHAVELPVLGPDEALALLIDQLPGEPDPEEQVHLERIAIGIDGHPLTLELAAGWVELLGAVAVADQLEAGALPLASEGPSPLLDRVMMTLGLVEAPAAAAFPRLAVFRSDFDAAAMAAVGGLSARAAAKAVRELRRVSLIHPGSRRGSWRLLAGVRDAAFEIADATGSFDDGRAALLDWLRTRMAPYGLPVLGLDADAVTEALDPWRADLRGELEAAADRGDLEVAGELYEGMYWYWSAGGNQQEAIRAAERLLPLCDADPTHHYASRVRSAYCLAGGTFAWQAEKLDDAELALQSAEATGDEISLYMARSAVALGAGWSGDLARAEQMVALLLAEHPARSTHPYLSVLPMEFDAALDIARGCFDEARSKFEQVRDAFESIGSARGEAKVVQYLSWIAGFEGDVERGESLLRLTVAKGEQVGDVHNVLHGRIGLADLLAGSDRPAEARREYTDLLPALMERGDIGCTAQCFCGLAETSSAIGEVEAVEWLLADAALLATRVKDGGILRRAIVGLAELSRSRGRPEEAARLLGCLSCAPAGGRPARAEDNVRLEALRRELATELDDDRLATFAAEGTTRGAVALVAQVRSALALTGSTNPVAVTTFDPA